MGVLSIEKRYILEMEHNTWCQDTYTTLHVVGYKTKKEAEEIAESLGYSRVDEEGFEWTIRDSENGEFLMVHEIEIAE